MLGLAVLAFSRIYLVDDAYISFRYAHHLTEGHGLVFNSGERVEGNTSLLWTLLMAAPEALNVSVSSFAVSLGLFFGFLALFEVWRTCRSLGLSPWGTGAAVIGLGSNPEYWLTVTMGLEGGLFAFLLSRAVYSVVVARNWSRTGIYGGLLFATRPEAVLLLPVFAAYAVFTAWEDHSVPQGLRLLMRPLLSLLAPWLVLVGAVTVWRLAYYGAWLPNSVMAKSPPEYSLEFLWPNFADGAEYLTDWVLYSPLLVLGAFLAAALAWRRPVVWLCLGSVAAEVAAVLLNGGDWMANHRLIAAYAPLLAILLGVAVEGVRIRSRVVLLTSTALLAVAGAFTLWHHSWQVRPDLRVEGADGCYRAIATELTPALRSSDVIAPEALGLVSYLSPEVYSHDVLGLTDKEVAKNGPYYLPTFGKFHPLYTFYDVRPTLYVTHVGTQPARWLEHLTDGEYTRRYSTYRLHAVSHPTGVPGCGGTRSYVISVRKGEAELRLLPAVRELEPKEVAVPYRQNYVPWFKRG